MCIEKVMYFDNEEIHAITKIQNIIKDICNEFNKGKCQQCLFDGICIQMKEFFDVIVTNGDYIVGRGDE